MTDRFHPAATPGTRAVVTFCVTLQGTDEERIHRLAREMSAAARYVLDHNDAGIVAPRGITLDVQTSDESEHERKERARILDERAALRAEIGGQL